MSYLVGLTGGIGSGKSAAAAQFAHLGVSVIDTDAISRELTAADGAALPAILAAFGPETLSADGSLDRARMRALVFSTTAARARLEAILHPMILRTCDQRAETATSPYVVLDIPLLIEGGESSPWRRRCQRVCVVDCPPALQIERVRARSGLAPAQIEAIIAAQANREARLAAADDVIDNRDTLAALHARVAALHGTYLELAIHSRPGM
ncbi:dephospho-CoA kinase [Betaproteobacteria bacterium]|nr:dephospho-CoA kinase [Betaproteobacteria bacterium]